MDQSFDLLMSAISQEGWQVEQSHHPNSPHPQRQQRDSAVEQHVIAPTDLPPEVQRLAQLSSDPSISDNTLAAELRSYFRMKGVLPASTSSSQQTTMRGPLGLQFGDAPYIDATDQHLRSDAVRRGVQQWQQSNQRSERSASRRPAGQGPQRSEGRFEESTVVPRDSVSQEVVQAKKGEHVDSRKGEEARDATV